MLHDIFEKLDLEISKSNEAFRKEGTEVIPRFYIKVLGQAALIEANLGIDLLSTVDVDAYANFTWFAKTKFQEILSTEGKHYDELSSEIWMPQETEYKHLYQGVTFDGFVAEPEYVLISKAKHALQKNKNLLIDYITKGPSEKFLKLVEAYKIPLEDLTK